VAGFSQTSNNKYDIVKFGAPPEGEPDWGDTVSIAADGKGSILVFRRAEPPVLIFNREGKLLNSWGTGLFPEIHSIDVFDGFVWITDTKDHMVYKFTMDGKQLMALGTKGVPGDNSSKTAFNRPTDVAIAPNGDIFVSDGYGNSRIVHFSKDGKFIKIIGGTKGGGPGEFNPPHAIRFDSKGRLIVNDWQGNVKNPRLQIFDQDGKFIEQWTNLGIVRPTGLAIAPDDTVYVGDTEGNSIWVLKDGKVLDFIGDLKARPHNIVWDAGSNELYFIDTTEPGQVKKVVRKK
jgi:DNA-binding beta-propeller fold protein YncE